MTESTCATNFAMRQSSTSGFSLFPTDSTDSVFPQSYRFRGFSLGDRFSGPYKRYTDRVKTFSRWPKFHVGPRPADLAMAGFSYTLVGDRVTCFCCGIVLQDWEEKNSAIEEHIKWSPQCEFVKHVTDSH